MNPPTLSTSIIKNLGKDFSKIDPTKLTEEVLGLKNIKKKKSAPSPSGKKTGQKKHKEA
ncbi:hypothetical protein HU200_037528 [Digitaria exilis]|uniref:Uncharacterized protein n=1 Tax=Digitaria exilis TaxID=1010633 RepID=A0A835BDZ1_9POAL|nr:hypothetical protein HU200_037528 [Digitaria exilis]